MQLLRLRAEAGRHEIFGAASDDKFLSGGTQRRKREGLPVNSENGFRVINYDFGPDRRGCPIIQRLAQVRHQIGALEDDEAVVKRIAFVGFRKAAGDYAWNPFELQRGGSLFAARA